MPRCPSSPALFPALLLGGVLAFSTLQVTPCRGEDIFWSHLGSMTAPPATTGGWVVFDSRRERFLHHPGGWFFESDPIGAPGLFGYIHPDGTYAAFPDSPPGWFYSVPDGPLPSRMEASAVYDSLTDRVILFGGGRAGSSSTHSYDQPMLLRNDVWVLDPRGGVNAQWVELAIPEPRPSPRHDASMILDTSRHRLLLFGGRDSSGALGDLWELSLDGAPLWRQIVSPVAPSRRSGHAAIYDPRRDRMVIACGVDLAGGFLADSWAFDPVNETWSELTPGGPAPDGPTAGAYDGVGDQMVTVSTSPVSPQPIRVRTLSLATGGTWAEPSIGPTSPGYWIVDWPTPHKRIAVAMSTLSRALMVLWDAPSTVEAVGFQEGVLAASLARFQPVERLVIQFEDPTPFYSSTHDLVPDPALLWRVRQRSRNDYGPVRFRNLTNGFETSTFPNVYDLFFFHEPPATPGTAYTYRVSWFDGYAERDTEMVIHAAPHPQNIGFAFGPVTFSGRDVVVHFGASDDSARMLSRQVLERRYPPGNWQPVWDILFPVDTTWVEPSVPPGTVLEFRAGWGDPDARIWSSPLQVQTPRTAAIRNLANPARDQISFVVDIRDAGPCDVSVYDVSGRRLLKETFAGPGTHSLNVRGTAGLYFVRLVHGGTTESRRVVLIQ